jgi:hypothetical protein
MNLALVASFYSNGPFVITFACLAELLAYLVSGGEKLGHFGG